MLAAGALETLHGHSTALFQGAITDKLRRAMDRTECQKSGLRHFFETRRSPLLKAGRP